MGLVSMFERVSGTAVTYKLQSQKWSWSADLNKCQGQQQLTDCRAKGGLGKLTEKGVRDSRNSLSTKPRVSLISRLEKVVGETATHRLQSL